MTGLRIIFSAYSPLKVANNGWPLAMWATASGDFGTRMLAAGVDEVVFVGRAAQPVYLLMRQEAGQPVLSLHDAGDVLGKTTHEKIMLLAERHADAHVAALGPAGENWQHNYYAAIACSTGNEVQSGDCKPRFAGRGGMGSLMARKTSWPLWPRLLSRSVANSRQKYSRPIRKSAGVKAHATTVTATRGMAPAAPGGTLPGYTPLALYRK
jgi:aldehyde:ferredoxin oxidoreductase